MSWTKVLFNLLVIILLLVFIEVGAGFSRLLIGKTFKIPELLQFDKLDSYSNFILALKCK